MDKDNIEGVGIMWRRDGGQYHLPTLDRRQEDHDREKMIIILTLIEKNIILITILMTIMVAMMTEFLNHSGGCAFTRLKISYLQIFLLGMVYDKQFTTKNTIGDGGSTAL